MESVWEEFIESSTKGAGLSEVNDRRKKPVLHKDIVIIGGGIAGVLCAHMLAEAGKTVCLLEAENLFCGVTKNTTAHVNALQGVLQDIPSGKMRRAYLKSQVEAVRGIESLVKAYNIDCDFKLEESFLFGSRKKLFKEYKMLTKLGANVTVNENQELPLGKSNTIVMKE
ncbi:MAG: FAD-binding oxidoreductase, partial [Firmicutes bacterium]|nr:FAD-binding oxidoreductase [Bacillota bacterium]